MSNPQPLGAQNSAVSELTQWSDSQLSNSQPLAQSQGMTEALGDPATAADALQSEKMATLGMLVANVAHELNTPLGAIQASTENLAFSISQTLKCLPQLCQYLNGEQLDAFSQLLAWAEQDQTDRSSRQERQLRRSLQSQLEALQIENASSIAMTLSTMGIEQDLAPLVPLLSSPNSELFLDAAAHLSSIRGNSNNIGIAINRATKMAGALRNYARKGSQAKPNLSDLRTGIETVLTLYQGKLKHGIDVQKHFADVPPLLCYPEDLEQAWANLIGNAIQAMEGQGKLDISLTQEEDQLIVTITDSGPGIPTDIQNQIFTPYFTTKSRGEGSGLGLSITQKIIERHGGEIELDSTTGKTSFRISLPLTGATTGDKDNAVAQTAPLSPSPQALRVSTVP